MRRHGSYAPSLFWLSAANGVANPRRTLGPANVLGMKRRDLLVALLVFVPAVGSAQTEPIRVCTHANAGFFTRDEGGTPTGLEADLLTRFAAATNAALTFQDDPTFEAVLANTESGQCQIGASTVTVTEARKARFVFSTPYFPNRVVVVHKTANPFTQAADLKDHRVAVVKGTLSVGFISAVGGAKPVLVESDAAAFAALLKGDADAVACDSAVVLHFLNQHPDLGMAFPIGERSFFAFILQKGSKLQGPLDAYLKKLVPTKEFALILAKHFGESNAEFLASEVAAAK